MKVHSVEYYESNDGRIFSDESDCMKYEFQKLYEASGYRFYKDGRKLDIVPEDLSSVNSFDYYTLDVTKIKENRMFTKYGTHNYGYLFDSDDWPPPKTDAREWFINYMMGGVKQ